MVFIKATFTGNRVVLNSQTFHSGFKNVLGSKSKGYKKYR